MDNFNLTHHVSGQFDKDLELVRSQILEMGNLVQQQIALAVEAFTTMNIEKAEFVISQDDFIDQLEKQIDIKCTEIIATRQPVGYDLSLLLSIIKVTGELEGIAAKAEGIADTTIQLKNTLPNGYEG